MVSLVDIVPQTGKVQIAAGELELRGLSLRHIADLLVRFPELRKLFAEGAPALDFDALIEVAPDAVASIIAEAAEQPGSAPHIAEAMPLEDMVECLMVVRDLTMPSGPAPFMERLTKLIGGAAPRADGQLGREADMSSPPPPNNSSLTGTDHPMSGDTPPAK
jgi:hypothetical protein